MTVKFHYHISGMTQDADGEVDGSGKEYDDAMQDAYKNICNEKHNQYLTVTFRKLA